MPNIEDVLSGDIEVNQLKKIDVGDLLGREPVELDMALISKASICFLNNGITDPLEPNTFPNLTATRSVLEFS